MTENKEDTSLDPLVSTFVDGTFKVMQGLVLKGEEVCPQVFLFATESGAPAIIPLVGVTEFFESKETKRLLRPLVKKVWKQMAFSKPDLKLIAVMILSDAWTEMVSVEEWAKRVKDGDTSLADKPCMGETLLIQISLSDRDLTYEWSYVRGDGKIVFTDAPTSRVSLSDEPKARLMGLWPL